MERFRTWTAGLISRVDWMVSQVENHEALAQSAIRGARARAAGAGTRRRRAAAARPIFPTLHQLIHPKNKLQMEQKLHLLFAIQD